MTYAIVMAVALPLKQLVLCSPLVGSYAEAFYWTDFLALALVLVGYTVYQGCSPEGHAAQRTPELGENESSRSTSSTAGGARTLRSAQVYADGQDDVAPAPGSSCPLGGESECLELKMQSNQPTEAVVSTAQTTGL